MDKTEKYYQEDIFLKFVKPYFSNEEFYIDFGWDSISRAYRYIITPKKNKNKFLSLFLHKNDTKENFKLIITFSNVDENNNYNRRRIMFLLGYDDIKRFNSFYTDFVKELKEDS